MRKFILPALLAMSALYSCQEEIITPEPMPSDPMLPLEVCMSTETLTKGLIKDTRLPDGASVGITVKDSYGVYTGELFTNIKYTARSESGNQVWISDSPVMLSSETGTAYAYYPYNSAIEDITAVTVKASSNIQIDCMWGQPVSVSKDSRNAKFTMKHALAAVRITYVRGSYTGEGKVTKVSFGGSCIGTAGYLDITDGTLHTIIGKGGTVSPGITATTLSSTLQESEIIVIPTGEKQGKITITIDGKDYVLEFGDIDLRQGQITQFHLTVNDGELSLSDITVSEWTYAESEETAIKVSDKVTLTGDLEDIAVYNSVSNGVVSITAMPRTKGGFKDVEPVTISGNATLTQSSDP